MIRKARIKDAKNIQELINFFASQDLMMPRSLNEIYENIRDFWVSIDDNNKIVVKLIIDWLAKLFEQVIIISHIKSIFGGSEYCINI